MRGLINIIFGIIMVVGGLTGNLALIGTDSGIALAVVGGFVGAWGVYQLVRGKQS